MSEYIGNRGGIPCVIATQTSPGSADSNAVYMLPNHCFRFVGNKGLMVGYFTADSQPDVTGVSIISNETTLPALKADGSAVTTLLGGYHLLVFDKATNSLNFLN